MILYRLCWQWALSCQAEHNNFHDFPLTIENVIRLCLDKSLKTFILPDICKISITVGTLKNMSSYPCMYCYYIFKVLISHSHDLKPLLAGTMKKVNSKSQTPGSDHMKEDCHRKPASLPVFQEAVVVYLSMWVCAEWTGMPGHRAELEVERERERAAPLHSSSGRLLFGTRSSHSHSHSQENKQSATDHRYKLKSSTTAHSIAPLNNGHLDMP